MTFCRNSHKSQHRRTGPLPNIGLPKFLILVILARTDLRATFKEACLKATKAIPPRATSDRTHTISQRVKANVAIAAYYENKYTKSPIFIESSSDNENSENALEEPVQERELPPELCLPSFLIN